MQLEPKIIFRDLDSSDAAVARIRQRIEDLDQLYDRITGCTVVVERRHRHQHHGEVFHVRIELLVPGKDIVVGRDPDAHHAHEDIYVAIRDAFDATRRQLQDHVRQIRDAARHGAVG